MQLIGYSPLWAAGWGEWRAPDCRTGREARTSRSSCCDGPPSLWKRFLWYPSPQLRPQTTRCWRSRKGSGSQWIKGMIVWKYYWICKWRLPWWACPCMGPDPLHSRMVLGQRANGRRWRSKHGPERTNYTRVKDMVLVLFGSIFQVTQKHITNSVQTDKDTNVLWSAFMSKF